MRLIELKQIIYQETPMISEKLHKNMNLLQRKKKTIFYLKIPSFYHKRQFYEVSMLKGFQTMEFLKTS